MVHLRWLVLLFMWILSVTGTAQSQEGQNAISTDALEYEGKSASPLTADDVITNARMRAASGSLSRFSIASQLSYMGGSLENPFSEDRPNIAATTGTTDKALIDGQASIKYNLSQKHSLLAGVGLRWIAPLSTSRPTNYDGDRMDASNPYITYQYLFNWQGIQSIFQVQANAFTNTNLVHQGYVGMLSLQLEQMYAISNTRWTLGIAWTLAGAYFNKSGPLGDPTDQENYIEDLRTEQSDYGINIDPVAEYQFSDRFTFRTVTNLWNYEHLRSETRATTLKLDKVYQSAGIGIAVTRDIYLYPNVQFLLDDIRIDRTNIALSSFINVF